MVFLKDNLKRAIVSKKFIVSLLISFACIAIGIYKGMTNVTMGRGSMTLFFVGSSKLGISPISLLAPIICTLPFSSKLIEDSKSKFLLVESTKINKIKYINTLVVTTGISGLLSIAFPYFILFLINILFYGHNNTNMDSLPVLFSSIYSHNQMLYCLIVVLWYGFFGFVYSIFGMACSILTKKSISAIAFPILYYIGFGVICGTLGWLCEPVSTFDLDYQLGITIYNITVHLLIILFVSLSIIYFYIIRKFENYL